MKKVTALMLLLGVAPSMAAPAYWYRWESKLSAYRICVQTPPGDGWVQVAGPYLDAQCRYLVPKQSR